MMMEMRDQYARLFLPHGKQKIPSAGIQTPDGRYPNSSEVSLTSHFTGVKTYAFDVLLTDEGGAAWCKFGVLDIDDLGSAYECAQQLKAKAADLGIPLVIAFSGGKGIHCYLPVSRAVPKQAMVTVLKVLQKAVPFKGDLIPGDNYRVKLPPCFHQKARRVSYFLKGEEEPKFLDSTDKLKALLPEQLEFMKSIQPMDADAFMALSQALGWEDKPADYADVTPDLQTMPTNTPLPPCMEAFLAKGGAEVLGTYDSQNLLLLNFCNSAGFDSETAEQYADHLAKNTNPAIATGKSYDEKIRHWESMQGAPSALYEFTCPRILKAKKELGFQCSTCPVRPAGIHQKPNAKDMHKRLREGGQKQPKGDQSEDQSSDIRKLPSGLTGKLLKVLMSRNMTPSDIDEEIFDSVDDKAIFFAIMHEKFNHTLILAFLPQIPDKKIQDWPIPDDLKGESRDEQRALLVDSCDSRLIELKDIQLDDSEADDLLAYARELTLRCRTQSAARSILYLLQENKQIPSVLDFADTSVKQLLRFDQSVVESQQAFLEDLMNYLEDRGQRIPTGIPLLDHHLGGGLAGGSLAVFCSPPSGGKTAIAGQITDYVAAAGIPVLYVSIEMSRNALALRSISRMAGIDSKILERGVNNWGDHAEHIGRYVEHYADGLSPYLYVLDEGEILTPATIRSAISVIRAKSATPDDVPILVVIDYLQLLQTGNAAIDNAPNETVKITELAWKVKLLAKDTNVAIIAISDVTKEEQSNADGAKGMTLGAMRGSNRIAHSADYVMLLYSGQREKDSDSDQDLWTPIRYVNNKPVSEQLAKLRKSSVLTSLEGYSVLARLDLAKNRFGVKGAMIPLVYQKAYHRFLPVLEGGLSC